MKKDNPTLIAYLLPDGGYYMVCKSKVSKKQSKGVDMLTEAISKQLKKLK